MSYFSKNLLKSGGKLRFRRRFMDWFTWAIVTIAGCGVIGVLGLMFFYLFYEVFPLIKKPTIDLHAEYSLGPILDDEAPIVTQIERYGELGVVLTERGRLFFFELESGVVRAVEQLKNTKGASISGFSSAQNTTGTMAVSYSDGSVLVFKVEYDISYPSDKRYISPRVSYPLGEKPLKLSDQGFGQFAIQVGSGSIGIVLWEENTDQFLLYELSARRSFFDESVVVNKQKFLLSGKGVEPQTLMIDQGLRNLLITDSIGNLYYVDVSQKKEGIWRDEVFIGEKITAIEFLLGTQSWVVATESGRIEQWMLVRGDDNQRFLSKVRSFQAHSGAVISIVPEHRRKGFLTLDELGNLGVHYATSSRSLLFYNVSDSALLLGGISPRHHEVTAISRKEEDYKMHFFYLHNPHPEISFSALWRKVWYEGRSEPEYIWQASSATDEFEPKMSVVPLSLGTLKAAFYAMLFAIPIALMAAIYSATFMSPKMRGFVKPTIEIMEALPTIILGFLAGLWLAPLLENHLPAFFMIVIGIPVAIFFSGFLCFRLRGMKKGWAWVDGWEALILIPVLIFVVWLSMTLSPHLEIWFFDGSLRQWLTDRGIRYEQRNALVVGIAMGFAVIPTIFSIAEDAIFTVPKHLSQGALALGATQWQAVSRVVLLTASPGIFAAVMIGFGRAVGETMIVLMATGNSPVMNFNIFEGMRTLSANIAVELPEAAFGSTHYRILFLAGLLLLVFTFTLNTISEIVRQRLRRRYSSMV